MSQELAYRAWEATPSAPWPLWARYDNDCERRKRTSRDLESLGEAWASLYLELAKLQHEMEALCRVKLSWDAELHGAGCHVTDPGGWLQPHLDYALHPSGLERRMNLVLFLNPEWKPEWGGAFEAWDEAGKEATGHLPKFCSAVAWEAGDGAMHATRQVSSDAVPRVTAAMYWLAEPRPGCRRRRALFVPRRS